MMHDVNPYFYTKDLVALYLEDNAALADVTTPFLDALFKKVHVFKQSKQAFSFWLENHESIDIIFTDILMPEMSGIELCKKVLQINPHQKIVIVSADYDNDLLFELVNLGVSAFIRQPLDITVAESVLLKIGKKVVDKKELLSYQKKLEDGYGLSPISKSEPVKKSEPHGLKQQRVSPTIKVAQHDDYTQDDTIEMREIIDDIDYVLLKLFERGHLAHSFEPYMQKLISCYTNYAIILKAYPSFEFLSSKLSELSSVLNDLLIPHSVENISFVAEILESMTHSFVLFHRHIIEEQLYEPNFYDASLANDIDFIIATIRPPESLPCEEALVEFF